MVAKMLWKKNSIVRLTPCVHRTARYHTRGRATVRSFLSLLLHIRLKRNEKMHQENQ